MSSNSEKPSCCFTHMRSLFEDHCLEKSYRYIIKNILLTMIPTGIFLRITLKDDSSKVTLSNIGNGSNVYYGEIWCDCNNWRIATGDQRMVPPPAPHDGY